MTRLEACGYRATDELFITAGAYSKELARLLGSSMLLDTERGYHLLMPQPGISLRRPVLFPPQAFAATMMTEGLRLAGTVEFAGLSAAPDYRRAFDMAVHARRLLPGLGGGDIGDKGGSGGGLGGGSRGAGGLQLLLQVLFHAAPAPPALSDNRN